MQVAKRERDVLITKYGIMKKMKPPHIFGLDFVYKIKVYIKKECSRKKKKMAEFEQKNACTVDIIMLD